MLKRFGSIFFSILVISGFRFRNFLEGRFMLKRFGVMCFSFLVFSALFFAAQSDAFAQWVFDRDYSQIVQDYKETVFTTPRSGDEYDNEKSRQDDIYAGSKSELSAKNFSIQEYWEGEKRKCEKWRSSNFWKSKAECVQAMEVRKNEDAGEYIEALKKCRKFTRRE